MPNAVFHHTSLIKALLQDAIYPIV